MNIEGNYTPTHTCIHCGELSCTEELQHWKHKPGNPSRYYTCRNAECDIYGQTLAPETHQALAEDSKLYAQYASMKRGA